MKTLLLFILLLSLIVVVHEFGHFITAKLFNVYVQEFSLGMGPKLWSKKGKETEYCLRALPIGGFVAIAGDNSDSKIETQVDTTNIPKERCLDGIHPIKRIIIMMAGIIMNMFLAIFIVSMIYLSFGNVIDSGKPIAEVVQEGYPAYEAGMKDGDLIKRITLKNGYSISPNNYEEYNTFMLVYDGKDPITFTVDRDGEKIDLEIMPNYDEETGRYLIGIYMPERTVVETNIFNCWKYGFKYLINIVKITLVSIAGLFRGVGVESLSGPVGVYEATEEAIQVDFTTYLCLIAILSINIGLVNALPLPILDGGRIVFVIYEWITKKKISKKFEGMAMQISAIVLIGLVVLVTLKDLGILVW